jgi:hypothetical protein
MYLVLFRKPHAVISFAAGAPPEWFDIGEEHYTLLAHPRVTATWRVDEDAYPVAVISRLEPGEEWPIDILRLPRVEWDGKVMISWLTTERNFERRDMLCDDARIYRAGPSNYAFCFSLEGISAPSNLRKIVWPKAPSTY